MARTCAIVLVPEGATLAAVAWDPHLLRVGRGDESLAVYENDPVTWMLAP